MNDINNPELINSFSKLMTNQDTHAKLIKANDNGEEFSAKFSPTEKMSCSSSPAKLGRRSNSEKVVKQPPRLPLNLNETSDVPHFHFGQGLNLNTTQIVHYPPKVNIYQPSMIAPFRNHTPNHLSERQIRRIQNKSNFKENLHMIENGRGQRKSRSKKRCRNKSKKPLTNQVPFVVYQSEGSHKPASTHLSQIASNYSPTQFVDKAQDNTNQMLEEDNFAIDYAQGDRCGATKYSANQRSANNQPAQNHRRGHNGEQLDDREDQEMEDEEQSKIQKIQRFLSKPIFDKLDLFEGGTFKFEHNKNFTSYLAEFEQEMLKECYNRHYPNQARPGFVHKEELAHYVEEAKSKKMPHLKHFKTYVPIFPQLYQSLDFGRLLGNKRDFTFYGEREIINPRSGKYIKLPKIAQLKFSIKDNALLQYEETRKSQIDLQTKFMKNKKFCDYLFEIDFKNIKTVWVSKQNCPLNHPFHGPGKIFVDMYIQVRKPCNAFKFGPNFDFSEVTTTKEEAKDHHMEDQENLEIDIIANNSATKMHRSRSIDHSAKKSPQKERAVSIEPEVKQKHNDPMRATPGTVRSPFNMMNNEKPKRDTKVCYETLLNYWNNNQVIHLVGVANPDAIEAFIECINIQNSRAKVIETSEDIHKIGINKIPNQKLIREQSKLQDGGLRFAEELDQMKPSLKFSLLALLSQNKFNIFNKGLYEFMQMLNNGGWNTQGDRTADFGAYLIDHINMFKELDYKDDSVQYIQQEFTKLSQDKLMIDEFKKIQDHHNLVRQRRVLITPTLMHFTVAKEEESNKVIRQFKNYMPQFIRLSFVNEQLEKGFYFGDRERFTLGYIHSIIKNGLQVGNLKTVFLSYSNSQLKNHTCWFLAQVDNGITEQVIINHMGNFSREKNILKRYARRGQCFSTTKNVYTLNESDVQMDHPDIEKNGFCFSDGCGFIHPKLAEHISRECYQTTRTSAFQIRLGGAKGVLVVNQNTEEFLENKAVLLRESQIKFPSKNLSLDIVRCATYSQGFLNRQIIILLNCLGVPKEYFMKKQMEAKKYIQLDQIQKRIQEKIEKYHTKFENLLSLNSGEFGINYKLAKGERLRDLARDMKMSFEPCKTFQSTFKQALMKGVDYMNDPIMSSIMYTMQLNQYLNLRKKARILLPDSCVLIGVIDPTGTLEENEIFVQIRRDNWSMHSHGQGLRNKDCSMKQAQKLNSIDGISQIIEGDVLITRNPCVHPGDIRLLQCIDNHELRYLFNVVVFSSKGERPQCNMMSGGDLDGDVYFVTWEKELLSYIKPENIKKPADYSKNELIKEKPDNDQLCDYFTFYLQRDVLGTVSNLWLKLCDKLGPDGPCDPRCLSLSYMCSVAVDFAKHGECVSKQNFISMQQEVELIPDFMEKQTSRSYKSEGVLGYLFRDINTDVALNQFIANEWENSIQTKYDLDLNILDLVKDQKEVMYSYLESVYTKIVNPMTLTIKKIMMNFNLVNEGELFACDLRFRLCHLGMNEDQTFYMGDPGCKQEDAIQNLNTMKRRVIEDYRKILNEIINEAEFKNDKNAQLNVAVALYLASYFTINGSCKEYYRQNRDSQMLFAFAENCWMKSNQEVLNMSNDQSSFYFKVKSSITTFKVACAEAEQGNKKKMRELLGIKKLFCIPWLLVGDILLIQYPDKFDSDFYKQKVAFNINQMKKQPQVNLQPNFATKQEFKSRFTMKPTNQNQPNQNVSVQQMKTMTKDQKIGHIFQNFKVKQSEKENQQVNLLDLNLTDKQNSEAMENQNSMNLQADHVLFQIDNCQNENSCATLGQMLSPRYPN